MRFFSFPKLTLTQKLIVSFAVNGICMVAALAYAISGLNGLRHMVKDIATSDLGGATAAYQLRESMLAQERTARRFLIIRTPALVALHGRQADQFRQILAEARVSAGQEAFDQVGRRHRAYMDLTRRLFTGATVDEEAIKRAAESVETAIEGIRSHQQKVLELKLRLSAERETRTEAIALGLAASGVLLSLVVAGLLIYSFSSSIGKLQRATHRIAAGDFDHDPGIPEGDEIGSLAADFLSMAARLKELEQISLDASPLTRLPGNIAIERAIDRRLRDQRPFAVCYLDLDNFKSYNDRYGYIQASDLIRVTGQIIHDAVNRQEDPEAFVGHIGGDDFVVLIDSRKASQTCKAIINEFDAMIPGYYSEEDRRAGAIEGLDRYGVPRRFPLMTISIAVLNCQPGRYASATEIASAAAAVKDRVKEASGSNYIIVREAGDGEG